MLGICGVYMPLIYGERERAFDRLGDEIEKRQVFLRRQAFYPAAAKGQVRALYDFNATEPEDLTFRRGDIITVVESVYRDWWRGSLRGETGVFPLNYVEKYQAPTHEEA